MESDRNKCGLSSLIPMSCRGRAEAFARSLHSRLSSLGSVKNDDTVDEHSWLAISEKPVTISQPRQAEADLYFDLDEIDPLRSPEEEPNEPKLEKLINPDDFGLFNGRADLTCPRTVRSTSYDSDSSESLFYDSENHLTDSSSTHLSLLDISNEAENGKDDDNNDNHMDNTHEPSLTCTPSSDSCLLNNEESTRSDDVTVSQCNNEEKSLILDGLQQCDLPEFTDSVPSNDHEEDIEEAIPRARRCASLKTGKTPPGTPGHKKIVRFADALGLDLADVRTFLDEIPKVPSSAYKDLKDIDDLKDTNILNINSNGVTILGVKIEKIIIPLFQQPGGQFDFLDKVRTNQVCLDNAIVQDPSTFTICGTVRVRNLDFHKSVHIRYSLDSWRSFADVQATYVENSCDGFSDKFLFQLFAHCLSIGQRLEFAIRFQCKGCQYWDNNNGNNYCFQCLPAKESTSASSTKNDWSPSFY